MCSIGSGVWFLKNQGKKDKRNGELRKEISDQLDKDEKASKEMESVTRVVKKGDFGDPSRIFYELHIRAVELMCDPSVIRFGKLLQAFPPVNFSIPSAVSLMECLPMLSEKATLEGMEKVAEQSAASAVKFMPNGLVKKYV